MKVALWQRLEASLTTTVAFPSHRLLLRAFLAFFAWAALCYGPALNGPFIFDDEQFIVKNVHVHSLANLGTIFRSDVTRGAGVPGNFYRPVQQSTFALIYSAVGSRTALPYHLLSVTLHAVCATLLLAWLLQLGLPLLAGLIGAGLFLTHPVQSEAVAYISGLSDPLALAFMLAALLLFTKSLPRAPVSDFAASLATKPLRPPETGMLGPYVICALLCMTAALFTKESGVILGPIAVCLYGFTWRRTGEKPGKSAQLTVSLLFLLALLWAVLKMTVLDFTGYGGLSPEHNEYTDHLLVRLSTFANVIINYVRLLVLPDHLNYEKPYGAFPSVATAAGIFGLSLLAISFAVIIGGWRRRWFCLPLGVAIFWTALAPFVGVVPLNAMYLEHWLYAPMIGIALVAAGVIHGLLRTGAPYLRPVVGAGLALLFTAYSVRVFLRAAEWGDTEKFYLSELQHGSVSTRMYNNIGMYYADHQRYNEAAVYYREAIAVNNGQAFPQPHLNLARVLLTMDKIAEGKTELRQALQIDPRFIYSLSLLYELQVHAHEPAKADQVKALIEAVQRGENLDYTALEAPLLE